MLYILVADNSIPLIDTDTFLMKIKALHLRALLVCLRLIIHSSEQTLFTRLTVRLQDWWDCGPVLPHHVLSEVMVLLVEVFVVDE